MKQKRHSTRQIIGKLRGADAQLASGATVAYVCLRPQGVSGSGSAKGHAIVSEPCTVDSNPTLSGVPGLPAQGRLRTIEKENARLRTVAAVQAEIHAS
jgi:hypothetical protein